MTFSPMTIGELLPRSVSTGSVWTMVQSSLPSSTASVVSLPSTLRNATPSSSTTGAASTSLPTSSCQTCSPVSASSASSVPSVVPNTTMPPPTPGPAASRLPVSRLQMSSPLVRLKAAAVPSWAPANMSRPSVAGASPRRNRSLPSPTLALQTSRTVSVSSKETRFAGGSMVSPPPHAPSPPATSNSPTRAFIPRLPIPRNRAPSPESGH